MKIDMNLKPQDIVLLKVLSCIVIAFFMLRFLILPGIDRHEALVLEKEALSGEKLEMEETIAGRALMEETIEKQEAALLESSKEYYGVLESRQVDEIITGLILKHKMEPRYLRVGLPADTVAPAYQAPAATSGEGEKEETEAFYVHETTVNITMLGTERQFREFLDDIVKNAPAIQVRSFTMQPSSYVDERFELQMRCDCVIAIYHGYWNEGETGT